MKFFYGRFKLIVIVLLSVLYNGLSVIFAFLLMQITDSIISGNLDLFFIKAIYTTICLFLQIMLYIYQTKYVNNYVAYCMLNLKNDLAKCICNFSYHFFAESPIESYQSFFLNDLKLFEKQYYRQMIDMFSSISLLIVAVVGICLIDITFLIVVAFIILVAAIIPILFKNRVSSANQSYSSAAQKYFASLSEVLQGFYEIKNYNVATHFLQQLSKDNKKAEESFAEFQTQITVVNAFMAFISQILILASFALGGYFSVIGRVTTGSIVALSQLLTYTIEPISVVVSTVTNINAVQNTVDNCNQILNYSPSISPFLLQNPPQEMELRSVSFSYNQIDCILDDVNVKFETPYKYAIIGKNGTGKSTILKLLAGILEGYSGQILIDGTDIKTFSENEYNMYISYLTQSSFVFSMSLDDNISMFKSIDDVLKKQLIQEFRIQKTNDIKVTSDTISGGEKSKIATIRTFLKDSPFILLDEPTAAMDEQGKMAFDSVLSSIKNKLCIVVTHRLDDSLKKYDRYVILHNGRLNCIDSYENLMKLLSQEDKYL